MALDVYHQVLEKLIEACGGNLRQMVYMVDILKREKLIGSQEMILSFLHEEGWIADAPKKDHVFLTSWGMEEIQKTRKAQGGAAAPAGAEPKAREAASLARELAALLDSWEPGAGKKLKAARAALDEALDALG